MPSSRRCVFGCVTKGLTVHSFPNPAKFPEQFRSWVEIGGERLRNLSTEQIYPRMKVCDKHFIEGHRNRNNRLSALAVPTLYLPKLDLETTVPVERERILTNITNFPIVMPIPPSGQGSSAKENIIPVEPSVKNDITDQIMLSAAPHQPDTVTSFQKDHDYCTHSIENLKITKQVAKNLSEEVQGPHATQNVGLEFGEESEKHVMMNQVNFPATSQQSDTASPLCIQNDHDYCTRNIGDVASTKQVCKKLSTTKIQGARLKGLNMPYYKETERKTKNLRREIYRLRKKCTSFKSRLESASKLSDSAAFQRVTANMTLSAKIFTNMQFRETKKKPKGRRFTLEEKILSLSFYKRSPKAYTLLHKSFTLPSGKSLRNLLGKVKILLGINKPIFKKIRDTVAELSNSDRLCIIMFDEMSINPQVHYDANIDQLKGFATVGNKNKIADHALSFMVRGIKKQ
ncbi:unnamed protein product [Chilo suppressalis]|uniref:THAP-type domain-containing protein n=1 Tax=Chilo suppressalis TaxID=168631 RepID=A0ABN8BBY8_CHISP|nr:unnamed protein product [Chilo suppressalis]